MFRVAFRLSRFLARIPSCFSFGSRLRSGLPADHYPLVGSADASSRRPRRRALFVATSALVLGAALSACSPTFDWRTVMNNDNGYTVDFPAKPGNDQRPVQIGGTAMPMAMQTAEAGNAVFAIGTVMLPDDQEATQRAALAFLRDGLARNVGAAPDAHAVQIPLAAGGQVLGLEMKLSGEAGSQHEMRTVYARLAARGRHVYQAAIIADKPLQPEQVEQFFSSFKLY
jgi:hypothetical protein